VIRGIILIAIVRMTISFHSHLCEKLEQANLDGQLSTVATVIRSDFRLAGFNSLVKPFTKIGAQETEFLADIDNDSTVENVHYYLSDPPGGRHPRSHMMLYRSIDSEIGKVVSSQIIYMNIEYFDNLGQLTTDNTKVNSVNLTIKIESSYAVNDRFLESAWQVHLFPPNL